MKIEKILVLLTAVFFLVYGALFVLFPSALSGTVTGAAPVTTSGLIDMRATYGGMSIAVSVILMLLVRNDATVRTGLLGMIIVLMGMALARLFGIIVDGSPNELMYVYLVAELAPSLFALVLYLRNKNSL